MPTREDLWEIDRYKEVTQDSKAYTEAKQVIRKHEEVIARVQAIRKRLDSFLPAKPSTT